MPQVSLVSQVSQYRCDGPAGEQEGDAMTLRERAKAAADAQVAAVLAERNRFAELLERLGETIHPSQARYSGDDWRVVVQGLTFGFAPTTPRQAESLYLIGQCPKCGWDVPTRSIDSLIALQTAIQHVDALAAGSVMCNDCMGWAVKTQPATAGEAR